MRFIDHAFAITVMVFLLGAFVVATLIVFSSTFREFSLTVLRTRMLSPMQTVAHLGDVAVFVAVFVNNLIPTVLSFAYPLAIAEINWTPPLSRHRLLFFLSAYTFIAAFLIGFFSLGAPLATGWVLGGTNLFLSLISGARIHGPLEFGFVLLCIAEPLRISWDPTDRGTLVKLVDDRTLLFVSIAGLFVAAAIEVFLGI